ncbi:MAG: alkaline phosphatase family protein [Candidatus Sulfotelmatobacter sp.]
MPPNVQRMLALQLPATSSLHDVKHVVMLMQEDRSFDHYFGTLAGVVVLGRKANTPVGNCRPQVCALTSGEVVFRIRFPTETHEQCCTHSLPHRLAPVRPSPRLHDGPGNMWAPAALSPAQLARRV